MESLNKPSPQEEAMLVDLADAWLLRAPFGIETKTLYRLVAGANPPGVAERWL